MREEPQTTLSITPSKLELQLGEMIGTVKMTVAAIETLRQTVENLAERAAFKKDLESVRGELQSSIDSSSKRVDKDVADMAAKVETLSSKITSLQRLIYMAVGGITVIATLVRVVDIPIRMTIGS